ncbi:hypothetical protein K438DRAFT_1752632 [Mycena galopus ATCC 62051]|nr:hypothetical protein K438DRAFT_1752632 [Mycena galopus ATCC 62051]
MSHEGSLDIGLIGPIDAEAVQRHLHPLDDWCHPMGRTQSDKQKAHIASLPASRWKAKEYTRCLEETIASQHTETLALRDSNEEHLRCNAVLAEELEDANSHIEVLEAHNSSLAAHLSETQTQLNDAQQLIAAQSGITKQQMQRINRLTRDKLVLLSRITCQKQELAEAA